jgi:integrase
MMTLYAWNDAVSDSKEEIENMIAQSIVDDLDNSNSATVRALDSHGNAKQLHIRVTVELAEHEGITREQAAKLLSAITLPEPEPRLLSWEEIERIEDVAVRFEEAKRCLIARAYIDDTATRVLCGLKEYAEARTAARRTPTKRGG